MGITVAVARGALGLRKFRPAPLAGFNTPVVVRI